MAYSDPAKARAYRIKWDRENRERINERQRIWRANNPEKQKEYNQRDYLNREGCSRRRLKWCRAHPDMVAAAKARRKGLHYNAEGHYSISDIQLIYANQHGRCLYCMVRLRGSYHTEHIVPLSRGGSNWPSNIACACKKCNSKKNVKLFSEFYERIPLGDIV